MKKTVFVVFIATALLVGVACELTYKPSDDFITSDKSAGPARFYIETIEENLDIEIDVREGSALTLRIDMPRLEKALMVYVTDSEINIKSLIWEHHFKVDPPGVTLDLRLPHAEKEITVINNNFTEGMRQ